MNRIILDVEGTGSPKKALVYDLGGVVADGDGNILEQFDFVIEDIFFDSDKMETAFYKDKIPQYYAEIENGTRTVKTFAEARAYLLSIAKRYHVRQLWAYNAEYDRGALNYTSRKLLGRDFIPENMRLEFHCIMGAFMATLGHTAKYCRYTEITSAGRVRTNAENAYRYLIKNPEFVEAHTGLCDALIEMEILMACLKWHKKMDTEPKSLMSFKTYWEIQKIYKGLQ